MDLLHLNAARMVRVTAAACRGSSARAKRDPFVTARTPGKYALYRAHREHFPKLDGISPLVI
jgi:hypothetical protein